MSSGGIAAFRLVSAAPDRLAAFYAAIGFEVGGERVIDAGDMAVLGLEGGGRRLTLRLGPSTVEIDSFEQPGAPYPADANAADLVFQHLALVTDDAAAAWARAERAGAHPISRGGATTLPPSAGSVVAVKFRDPDGHPLEFLQFPPSANPHWRGSGVQGVDHSAVSVSDVARSRAFYTACGLAAADGSLNRGPTQVALDGLDEVEVEVAPMQPAHAPPHVELLGYRNPRGRIYTPLVANDVAATRIVWRSDRRELVRDPDGHLHELQPAG